MSTQALAVAPRRCFMMTVVRGNIARAMLKKQREASSANDESRSSLVPRPAWMRDTFPLQTDAEADDIWRRGNNMLSGEVPPLEPSSFTGGNTVKATAEIHHPDTGKHQAQVALDTQSDVTTCLRKYLSDVRPVIPDVVDGCGGPTNFTEEGTLHIYSAAQHQTIALPALVASRHQLPGACAALLGVPALLALEVAVDQHLKLPQFSPLLCHLGEKRLREWLHHHPTESIDTSPFDLEAIQINPALTAGQIRRVRN